MIRKKTQDVIDYIFYKMAVAIRRLEKETPKTNKGKLQKQKEIALMYDIAKIAAKRIEQLKHE